MRNFLLAFWISFAISVVNGLFSRRDIKLKCGFFILIVLKVAFSQKRLMRLSFLQTDEPNYFPELKFRFFHAKWLKSCHIRT